MQRTQHRRRGDVSSTKEIQINQSQLGSATELSCSLPAHTAGLNTPAKFSRSAWFRECVHYLRFVVNYDHSCDWALKSTTVRRSQPYGCRSEFVELN